MSCTNCHFSHFIKTGERKAIPVNGWVFLMNYRGKVTSANMQTFFMRPDKTFLMFSPKMSHSIMKEGRKCDDCHGAKVMRQVQKEKKIKLTWTEEGKVVNLKAVIPVVKGVEYECAYFDLKDGKWVPVRHPAKPILQFIKFGKPLTEEQFEALAEPQESSPPEVKPATKAK